MRFISCCSAGKVDISRQGQIFTRRSKETAVEDVNFYDRFHVRALTRVSMWAWTSFCESRWGGRGRGPWAMRGDHQLTLRRGAFYWLPSSCSYFWWGSNTLVTHFCFLFPLSTPPTPPFERAFSVTPLLRWHLTSVKPFRCISERRKVAKPPHSYFALQYMN